MAGNVDRYQIGRPLQDVRLRNWPAGKVAQLKRAVELMENELNSTMASQVDQGQARVLSPKVPVVTGLTIRAGFKNFLITYNAAKGIQDLLFYEIQKDATPKFANPTTFTIPQTTLTIPTTTEHETVYFRVRVINSKFQVGRWSKTATATGSSNFRISVVRQAKQAVLLTWATRDNWFNMAFATYSPTAASMCLHIHAGVWTKCTAVKTPTTMAATTQYIVTNTNEVNFRILRNGVEMTNVGTMNVQGSASYLLRAEEEDTQYQQEREEQTDVHTIITPFETFVGNEASVVYTLQAMLVGSGSSRTASGNGVVTLDEATVVIDCFDVVEIVQSF